MAIATRARPASRHELPQARPGGLVQQRDRVGGEELAVTADALKSHADVLGRVVAGHRPDGEAPMDAREQGPVFAQFEAVEDPLRHAARPYPSGAAPGTDLRCAWRSRGRRSSTSRSTERRRRTKPRARRGGASRSTAPPRWGASWRWRAVKILTLRPQREGPTSPVSRVECRGLPRVRARRDPRRCAR